MHSDRHGHGGDSRTAERQICQDAWPEGDFRNVLCGKSITRHVRAHTEKVVHVQRIAAEVQASTSGMSNVETMLPQAFLQAQSSWSTAASLPPMPTAAFSAEPTIPAAAPATMDILRSLGLSLDNLVTVSPPSSSGLQRSGEPSPAFGQTVAPDSVFDRIFEDADWLNSTIWQT